MSLRLMVTSLWLCIASIPVWAAGADPAGPPHGHQWKNSMEAAIQRGSIVFDHHCVLCHGAKADGNGRAAKIYNPRPPNLVTSDKNDQYKELIIRRGGAALMRSPSMPPWGEELTDEQINDLVSFLHSIQRNKQK